MQIYVQRNGQQAGPYTVEQIQSELAAGSLRGSDLAWYENAPNWLPLASVPGLNLPAPYHAPSTYPSSAPYPAPSGVYAPYAPPQTSGLAVASMVLGLLSFLIGVTSLPAVICGHVSLSQIKRAMGRLDGRGMAITGLVTGYLMLAFFGLVILAIIAGIALPVFANVSEKGAATRSMANAKQIGISCKLYAADNEGRFPKTLEELVPNYLTDTKLFVCPLDPGKAPMGYDYFGGTDSDDPRKVLLQSKAKTSDGKRVVVYVDDSAELSRR